MKEAFLPKDFKIPVKSNGYMKFKEGDSRFRVLSKAITGWVYYIETPEGEKNKVFRKRTDEEVPMEYRYEAKFFMTFIVWNYETKATEILEVTQKGVQTILRSLYRKEKWGDPRAYDIVVTGTSTGPLPMNIDYQTQADPKEEFKFEDKVNKDIVLEALYEGADPFDYKPKKTMSASEIDEVMGA